MRIIKACLYTALILGIAATLWVLTHFVAVIFFGLICAVSVFLFINKVIK